MALGTYERFELNYLLHRVFPGDLFLDVGAHIGYFSLPIAKRVGPNGRVIALEPTPESVDVLRRNAALNDLHWIEVIAAAASDRDGSALLELNRLSPMWNSLRHPEPGTGAGTVSVPTVSLDTVLAAAGWPKVAGMKLDVEGVEEAVLAGAREALTRNPGAFAMFEVSGSQPERRATSAAALEMLEVRGYRFRCLQEGTDLHMVGAREILRRLNSANWQETLFNVVAEAT